MRANVPFAQGTVRNLDTGDAARLSGSGGQRTTATERGAEVLIWEMHATLG
ncbi:MAG: hypothetical protein ACR2G2_08445 [Pseudonocardia sp.]